MTSSTDVLSAAQEEGSGVPDSDQNHLKQTPTSHKQRPVVAAAAAASQTAAAATRTPAINDDEVDEIVDEIKTLYSYIPQLEEVFTVIDRIGSGTFSSVYLAEMKNRKTDVQFALKHIIPTSHPSRIENELRCLQEIGGCDYVMGVKACVREKAHVVIVMPYFPHDRFQDYVQRMSVGEIRDYMRALLIALRRVHEVNIIHRDVKPSNFLYNRQTKQYSLVDFGLAMRVPGIKAAEEAESKKQNVSRTEVEKQPLRTSPRCPKRTGDQIFTKFRHDDVENAESARKKRHSTQDTKSLGVVDMNVEKDRGDIENKPSTSVITTPNSNNTTTNSKHTRTVKSPRRMLLTKRTLDMQQQGRKNVVNQKASAGGGIAAAAGSSKGGARRKTSTATAAAAAAVGAGLTCKCFGKPQVCTICVSRSVQSAPRAGTQGFRAPEVLMKYPDQTTAVDVWSAGVIMLSLLSGRYPFFKAPDDMNALAQLISVFGTENFVTAAQAIGKHLLCNPVMPSLDLRTMCQQLRPDATSRAILDNMPEEAYDLMNGLLDLNPHTRLTAKQALQHPFFAQKD